MKILFIHNRYQAGGGEDTTLQMEMNLLNEKGHKTRLLEFNNDNIDSFYAKIIAAISSFYNINSAKKLKATIEDFQPDIIHVHNLFFKASSSILYQAYKMNIPIVATVQNFRLICANAFLLRNNKVCELCINKAFPLEGIKNKCYRNSTIESSLVTAISASYKFLRTWQTTVNSIIMPSNFMKNKILFSSFRFPEKRIIVKHNFVNDIFNVTNSKEQRENFFLFAGRLSKEKGIEVLIKPFLENLNLRLTIAGDGPEKKNLLSLIHNKPNIKYIGLQSNDSIRSLMKKSKALIFPSLWYEGLPLTIIEAFSTGTPVIASNLGAMAEMIEDGYNGYHFIPGNMESLIKTIEKFESITDNNQHLYDNARKTYLEKYTPDKHYNVIMNLYEEVISTSK